jgi:putative restriction endonuclease
VAYWWVAQRTTFNEDRTGGLLWAPKLDKARKSPYHWANLVRVQPGDIVFSYVNQGIAAVGVTSSNGYEHERPAVFKPAENWQNDGYRVDVDYRDVSPPLSIATVLSDLLPLLPDRYSPLTRNGGGAQGYCFEIPPKAGRFLLGKVNAIQKAAGTPPIETAIERVIARSTLPQTTKTALIEARIGQGQFRSNLLEYWGGRCAVTGLTLASILRASHIKPWRDSNNIERLAVHNGLLLSPAYDALFDQGLISFDKNGAVRLSKRLSLRDMAALHLDRSAKLSKIAPDHVSYLTYSILP